MTELTIVIATFNRPDRLQQTLDTLSVAASGRDGWCRILVVDNGNDCLAEGTARASSAAYLRTEPGNKAAALNAGIAAAETKWLAFTDDDTLPDGAWLKEGIKFISESGVRIAGGRVVPGPMSPNVPRWLRNGDGGRVPRGPAVVSYEPMDHSGILDAGTAVPLGSNLFVRKEVFEEYGGYDEALWHRCGAAALGCEDAEFAMRVRTGGEAIGYCAEAVVVHPVYPERVSVREHVRWAYRNGVREAILFEHERLSLLRSMRLATAGAARSGLRFLGGNTVGAVCEMMAVAQAIGQWSGRKR